jgi:hypothetical protein
MLERIDFLSLPPTDKLATAKMATISAKFSKFISDLAALLMAKLFYLVSLVPSFTEERLELASVPGLMTLVDTALYQAVEGQLTATVTSSHNLLGAWLDLKRQAVKVLNSLQRSAEGLHAPNGSRLYGMESFAKTCLDVSCEVIQRLTTDRFAETANISSEAVAGVSESHHLGTSRIHSSMPLSSESATLDTGRRIPVQKRAKECWESQRLFCPDYVWADDAAQHCQRLLRLLLKNPYVSSNLDVSASASQEDSHSHPALHRVALQEASLLMLIVTVDLPCRLVQFRASIEADAVVSKRLYLVKSEYRTPFRAFLDAHQSLQRAPSLDMVNTYIKMPKAKVDQSRTDCKDRLQQLLSTPALVEALALEQKCEEYEVEMAKALYSFSELARYLDSKRARLNDASNRDLVLRDTLRRLKGLLCRKAGPDSSTGIRPILLDLQGVLRDEERYDSEEQTCFATISNDAERLHVFVQQLSKLQVLTQSRLSFFRADKRAAELDIPSSIVRGCEEFDPALFRCYYQDWITMVKRQHELADEHDLDLLSEHIRRAEMQLSLISATNQSLDVVRSRLEAVASDCQKRFQVLQEILSEVCLREMNVTVSLHAPDIEKTLRLQPTNCLGIFGLALQMAGETLPLG